jgi:CubicO group peptidase (beta-lactamase class C family)
MDLLFGLSVATFAGSAHATCLGDIDNSGLVDGADIAMMLGSWGTANGNPADINQDGWVDGTDLAILLGDWGCTRGGDRVGIFSAAHNYFELDVGGSVALEFHFGSQMSEWGVRGWPLSGDFDGDGLDTVCVADLNELSFLLADENDSDEFVVLGTEIFLTGTPEVDEVGDGPPVQIPVAGDWNGDGRAGVGIYQMETNTFYLRDTLTSGDPEYVVMLAASAGFPDEAYPIAGDFDGDGDDELGLFDFRDMNVYLTTSLASPTVAMSFLVPGGSVIAGDFDGNGVDTMAGFDGTTNEFTILAENVEGAATTTVQLGHAEPGFWGWNPLAGNWQVPQNPVAGQGYEWAIGDPAAYGVNPAALEKGLANMGLIENVQAVLMVRGNHLIGEQYYHGYDRHIAQNLKSASKSVLSGIFGIAYKHGLINLDDPVSQYMPEYFADLSEAKKAITIKDIMTMRSGLYCGPTPPEFNQAMKPTEDWVAYVLEQDLTSIPGTVYDYSTGLTHLGSAMITETVGVSTRAYAREHLFEPLGISTPRWDGSPEGYDFGGAEMWMRPRDSARFGQLYLDNGVVDDQQILDPHWVVESANPWVPECCHQHYGLWWREREWSNYPFDDSYFGWGYGGQFIFVFPTWDMVVVANSKWSVAQSEAGQVAGEILIAIDEHILSTVGD